MRGVHRWGRAVVIALAVLALSACATGPGGGEALVSARSADVPAGAASAGTPAAPLARTREDARYEQEMRASGWDRAPSGVYVRIVTGGVCSGACVVEALDPIDCPTGIGVEGVRNADGATTRWDAVTPPASAGVIVTVILPPPTAGTVITSAICAG